MKSHFLSLPHAIPRLPIRSDLAKPFRVRVRSVQTARFATQSPASFDWVLDRARLDRFHTSGGVIASVLVVACLFWVGLVDNIGYKNEGSLINISGISIAIGLYGYSYSGHAVFPNIYSSLKNKNEFPAVLFTSFVISALLFAGVAVMGFALFGESTQSQFTLNVPHEFMASKIAVWTTVVNPITKYSITLAPMALSLEELIPTERLESHWYAIIMRTALTISSLVVAMSVPFFGLVMALIGSLLTMLLAFILPCVCFLSIVRSKATWPQVYLKLKKQPTAVFAGGEELAGQSPGPWFESLGKQ